MQLRGGGSDTTVHYLGKERGINKVGNARLHYLQITDQFPHSNPLPFQPVYSLSHYARRMTFITAE